ncbi:MAG: hypothetical protein ACO3BO_06630 [Anaerohalosphaeraceae bacterium]
MAMLKRFTITLLILTACVAIPLLVEWKTTPEPGTRDIHMEFYRYGSDPAIIRANRGDEINLTFSTRDTGHSFLIQDYRIEAKVSPASVIVELRDPLDVDVPFEDVKEVQFIAGPKGWWGHLVNVSRFRCHIYCGRMHGFEQGDLIVRPNVLFSGSIGLLVGLIIVSLMRALGKDAYVRPISTSLDLNKRIQFIDKILKWRPLQFLCTLPVMAGFTLIVIAGFFGTKVGGRNIGVMLTWSVWMALLTMILVPFLGRSWCLLCPLPSLGEYLQRGATVQVRTSDGKGRYGNTFFGLGLRWPQKLRGPWLRMFIFLCMGTLSASMAGQPRWTAIALFSLCVLAIIMSLIWELRAFCRYVCPVSTFISLYSPLGRVEVRSRDKDICSNCKARTCLRGNDKGWACPYGLCVAHIDSNIDCGLCLECFKSCSYDNVALNIRKGAWYDTFKNYGQAWRVIVMMCLGMVYPLTILSPWPEMRDMVNVVDKVTWAQFGHYAVVLWMTALVAVPLTFWLMTRLGMKLSGSITEQTPGVFSSSTGDYFKKTMPALIPMGLSFWATFFVATVMVNFSYILLAISDPFGHGWDLLGIAGLPWVQIYPAAIPWLQAALIFTGLIFSFKKGFRFWFDITEDKKSALQGFAPTAAVIIILAAMMLVYFTNF